MAKISDEQLKFRIALTQIPQVGPAIAKNLLAYCGGPESVFLEKRNRLIKIPGVGDVAAANILAFQGFGRIEEEIEFIRSYGIETLFFTDKNYPYRLKRQSDAPMMLYFKGRADLNHHRIISIVGTRKATEYGRQWCRSFIKELAPYDCVVVSGLAYGIDISAHKASLENQVCTVGVVAHGLDRVYPAHHKPQAAQMVKKGGLLTEYISGTNPDRENFPSRNRIVAGICDATIVVESTVKGGAVITANIAHSYNRDVFAVPGRSGDLYSEGCNYLIKSNKAALLETPADLAYYMGWEAEVKTKPLQPALPLDLGQAEISLLETLRNQGKRNLDDLVIELNLSSSQLALSLLELELKGLIRSLPGKVFELAV